MEMLAKRVWEVLRTYRPTAKLFSVERCLEDFREVDEEDESESYFFSMSKGREHLCYISVRSNGISFCLAPEGCEGFLTLEECNGDLLEETTKKYIQGRYPETAFNIDWDEPIVDVIDKLPEASKYGPLRDYVAPFVGATLREFSDYYTYNLIKDDHARIAHRLLMERVRSILGR